MEREQIIEWGRQTSALVQEQNADVKYLMTAEELMDFAKLVRDDYSNKHAQLWLKRIDEAVKAEREACAKLVDLESKLIGKELQSSVAIRARGN
jgi:hypothetical protein